MKPLTQGEIQEAFGRAAMVVELEAIGRRLEEGTDTAHEARLEEREAQLVDRLWGVHDDDDEAELSLRDRLEPIDRVGIVRRIDLLLRRRPEVTPPDLDQPAPELREWLAEKVGELPEDERSAFVDRTFV